MAWGLPAAQVHDEGWTVGASVALDASQRAAAVLTVCRTAADASEAAMVLAMLGLDAAEARTETAA